MDTLAKSKIIETSLETWRERILFTYKNKDMTPGELSTLFQQKDLCESFFYIIDHDNNGSISEEEWTGCFSKLLGDNDSTLINWFADAFRNFCAANDKIYVELADLIHILKDLEFGYRFSVLIAPKCRRITNIQLIASLEMIASLSTDAKWLSWLKYQFVEAVTHGSSRVNTSNDCRLRFDDFRKNFNFKQDFLARRLFDYLDTDKSGFLSLHQFINGLEIVVNGSDEQKMKFLFKVFDMNGDGSIDYNELRMLLKCCLEDSPSLSVDEGVDDLAIALFRNTDIDCSGEITLDELKGAFRRHDGLFKTLSINTSIWIKPKFINQRKKSNWLKNLKETVVNRRGIIFFWTMYILIHIATTVHAYVEYRTEKPFYICARIFGNGLNFNCSLVLVLVLRKHFTWLRTKGAGSFLPLDHYIDIHKTIGIIILIETLIHTVAHLVNLFNECATYKTNYWIILFTDKESIGYPTGVIEFLLLVVILLFALPCVRSRGYFQLFYVVHLLTIPWLFIMLLHGKQFWKWLLIPGILYAVENILRFKKTRSNKFGDTYITEAMLLPSKVTHLVIRRPTKFQYNPGDYIFINIPAIAKHEWHPFSISSVPELEDHLWLHVRAVGNWTTKLNSFVRSHLETKYADESVFRMSMRSRMSRVLSETGVFQLPGGVIMNNSNSNKKVSWTNKDTLSDAIAVKSYYTSQISIDPMCTQKRKSILKNMSRDSAHYFRSTVQDPQDDTITLKCDESTMVDATVTKQHGNESLETCGIDAFKSTDKYSNNLLAIREPTSDDNNGHGKKASLYKKASISEAIAIEMVDHQTRKHATESDKKPKEDEHKMNNLNKKHSEDNSDVLGYMKMYTKANCLTIQQLPMDEQWRLQVYIDGPYGTINSDIYNAEHVVLIAAGIGITPHASILQSLMQRFKRTTNVCPNCDHTWESNLPCTYRSKIKKVDFIWVTREQRSLEWFLSMLSQMEIDQKKNNQHFLETHLYVTSAKRQTDLKSIGLHMTLDVIYSEEDSRYIEGLKERTHYGRPNWDIVLQQLIRKQEGKITVFFCGPLSLCNVLQTKCRDYNLIFKKEIF